MGRQQQAPVKVVGAWGVRPRQVSQLGWGFVAQVPPAIRLEPGAGEAVWPPCSERTVSRPQQKGRSLITQSPAPFPPSFHVCALAADHMSRSTWHTHHCSLPTLFGLLVWNSGVGQPAWDPLLCTPSIFLFLTSADPKCPSPAWLLLPEPQAHSASGCLVSVSLEGLANVSWSPVQRCGPWSHLNLSFTSLALLPTLYPRL